MILVRKAKEGDRKAWAGIYERHYTRWCRRWHGQIGRDLRRGYETRDLVQSAMVEALRDIGDLSNEEAFFAWVNTIVHRKIIAKRRKAHGRRAIPLDQAMEPAKTDTKIELPLLTEEDQRRVREAVVKNLRNCPNQMKAVWLKYCEKVDMAELQEIFGMSERSVYRLVEEGLSILRAQLDKK